MLELTIKSGTTEDCNLGHDIFYRALRKLISEGRDSWFGGMTEQGVKMSVEGENKLLLIYREFDPMPIGAISLIRKVPEGYQELFDGIPEEDVALLNAMAVRPELWGQGYMRQALHLCLEQLEKQGIKAVVGTVCPDNMQSLKTLERVCSKGRRLGFGDIFV